jgi:hypothetical protein
MYRGLIKVIQKGDTTGEELKNCRPITLLSQIYKKLIRRCQKVYQNTANIGEILLDILETIYDYIYESLNFFNFGDYFIEIVKTMLTGRNCAVMVDAYETNPSGLNGESPRGTRPAHTDLF